MLNTSQENQVLREAFLQLVGLNVKNTETSPAVVLTDLNSKHYVLYLELIGDPERSLQYALKIHSSTELRDVLMFANEKGRRRCITGRLGTMLTPPQSEDEHDELEHEE
jgi:hypothetical protein